MIETRRFWKYNGLGNDFILFDATKEGLCLSEGAARGLCDRRRGIGADGVLVLSPSACADVRLTIFNADGSEAEMCGNGLRCAARFLDEVKGARGRALVFETRAGPRTCRVDREVARCLVTAGMGAPTIQFVRGQIEVGERAVTGTAVSMGNPHLVLFDLPAEDFATLASRIERHAAFPNRTNIECACAIGPNIFEVLVWERGCGFTEACGTGACAVAVAARVEGRAAMDAEVELRLPGGSLFVRVDDESNEVVLRGEAALVFEGSIDVSSATPPSR
ncbi:MAG: diaminopimelate epimerase [Myxococcales bacterium]|jgi:diaminopimelate epimerase|nr:diaminopimelate epimerase [Myxococcales bacterium]